jgi:hypothetical protein
MGASWMDGEIFVLCEKSFELAKDGKLWKTPVGRQTYSNGIVPHYRLAIYGPKIEKIEMIYKDHSSSTVSRARSAIHYRFPSWCSEFQPTLSVQNSTNSTTINRGRD